jgi:hypothetical protein
LPFLVDAADKEIESRKEAAGMQNMSKPHGGGRLRGTVGEGQASEGKRVRYSPPAPGCSVQCATGPARWRGSYTAV